MKFLRLLRLRPTRSGVLSSPLQTRDTEVWDSLLLLGMLLPQRKMEWLGWWRRGGCVGWERGGWWQECEAMRGENKGVAHGHFFLRFFFYSFRNVIWGGEKNHLVNLNSHIWPSILYPQSLPRCERVEPKQQRDLKCERVVSYLPFPVSPSN